MELSNFIRLFECTLKCQDLLITNFFFKLISRLRESRVTPGLGVTVWGVQKGPLVLSTQFRNFLSYVVDTLRFFLSFSFSPSPSSLFFLQGQSSSLSFFSFSFLSSFYLSNSAESASLVQFFLRRENERLTSLSSNLITKLWPTLIKYQ